MAFGPKSQEHNGPAWKFVEILARAGRVFESQAEAEQWLDQQAIGLDQRHPIDLLATAAGVELVDDCLSRIEYRDLGLSERDMGARGRRPSRPSQSSLGDRPRD
jgi:putative toxin-antitoxin system antitoxin component (TIGR02293 family)